MSKGSGKGRPLLKTKITKHSLINKLDEESLLTTVTLNGNESSSSEDDENENDDQSSIRCTETEKRLTALVVLTFVIIFIMAGFLVFKRVIKETQTYLCTTPDCITTSGRLISNMNLSQDPCYDFYNYACGNWEKNVHVPPNKPTWNSFKIMSQDIVFFMKKMLESNRTTYKGQESSAVAKSKQLYRACMNKTLREERGDRSLRELIKHVGSWNLTNDNITGEWNPNSWDIEQILITLHKEGFYPLFNVEVTPDPMNSSRNILEFAQDGLSLPTEEMYFNNESQIYKDALVRYCVKIVKLLGGNDDENTKKQIDDLFEFETKLAKIFVSKDELLDPFKTYHHLTITEFQKSIGNVIDIRKFLFGVLDDMDNIITASEEIIVSTLPYFKEMVKLLKNTSVETLANYMVWHVVSQMVSQLTREYIEAAETFYEIFEGVHSEIVQWANCVNHAHTIVPFATSAIYIEENFPPGTRELAETMITNIKEVFIQNLEENPWMDKETKFKAAEKARAIVQKIAYPEWLTNVTKLDEYYEKLNVTDDNFINVINAKKYQRHQNFQNRRKSPDRNEWQMAPAEVNAYYAPSSNDIVFPAAILVPPFFDKNVPACINYGAIGTVMGHELTHGFDSSGRFYDKTGNLANWWKNSSLEHYVGFARCFVDSYSHYNFWNKSVNGLFTLGENIADNGGVRLAFKAYKHSAVKYSKLPGLNLSPDQLFFISFAQVWCNVATKEHMMNSLLTDVHSPALFRILGTVSNSVEFAEAFKCSTGSPMNPTLKCTLW